MPGGQRERIRSATATPCYEIANDLAGNFLKFTKQFPHVFWNVQGWQTALPRLVHCPRICTSSLGATTKALPKAFQIRKAGTAASSQPPPSVQSQAFRPT